jgi:hypothetical protein
MYGVGGERWLPELTLPWLKGYADSSPVRIGNAACDQMQIVVFGEIADAAFQTYKAGMPPAERGPAVRPLILESLFEFRLPRSARPLLSSRPRFLPQTRRPWLNIIGTLLIRESHTARTDMSHMATQATATTFGETDIATFTAMVTIRVLPSRPR